MVSSRHVAEKVIGLVEGEPDAGGFRRVSGHGGRARGYLREFRAVTECMS